MPDQEVHPGRALVAQGRVSTAISCRPIPPLQTPKQVDMQVRGLTPGQIVAGTPGARRTGLFYRTRAAATTTPS